MRGLSAVQGQLVLRQVDPGFFAANAFASVSFTAENVFKTVPSAAFTS